MTPRRRPSLRPAVLGPVAVTVSLGTLAVPAVLAVGAMLVLPVGVGWLLTWLLLGLTAGYALSGSA